MTTITVQQATLFACEEVRLNYMISSLPSLLAGDEAAVDQTM